ncbi:MAG: hypothetical protein ACI9A7_002495, partial [Cyclobacteriaceae bacterium]
MKIVDIIVFEGFTCCLHGSFFHRVSDQLF